MTFEKNVIIYYKMAMLKDITQCAVGLFLLIIVLRMVRRFLLTENYYANTVDVADMIDPTKRSKRGFLKAYRDDKQTLDVSQINMSKLVQSYPDIDIDRINTA